MTAVQSPSEARIEQLIASALKDFASYLPKSPQIKSQSTPIKRTQMLDKENKNPIKCFFCKHFGQMKKDCRSYKKWLEKQESKANNLNDNGLDGKTTQPNPKKVEKVGLVQKKNLEFEHSKDSGFIDRACCSSGVTNLQIQAQQTLIKSEADDKTILKGQSGGRTSKNAPDDTGTCSTK